MNIQHRAILYQHITIMNIQYSSFIITQFGTGKRVIRDSAIKHFTKLPLFPSVSKSLESDGRFVLFCHISHPTRAS